MSPAGCCARKKVPSRCSCYFRDPAGKHPLSAQDLIVFCQIAEGIGEGTWMFHLRRHDYSRWVL
jgi:hypothetical protein